MSAATMTPAAAADDLLGQLRDLLNECGPVASVEDVRRLCKRLSAAVGRARRQVTRYEQLAIEQAAPKPAAVAETKPEPAPTAPAVRLAPPPAETPAPNRAEVRIPPSEPPPDRQAQPESQQERPPEPPPEAPETPPLPPKGPRSWGAWLNAWLLAAVSTVIALILGVRGICSLIARGVRPVCRRTVALARTLTRKLRF